MVLRGIVFVDLALAQISSLGVVVGLLIGFQPVITSILFTFLGATLFALVRIDETIGFRMRRSLESFTPSLPQGPSWSSPSHRRVKPARYSFSFGNILAVTPGQLWQMAIAFGLIGLFHGIFQKKFILLSQEHERPKNAEFSVPPLELPFSTSHSGL